MKLTKQSVFDLLYKEYKGFAVVFDVRHKGVRKLFGNNPMPFIAIEPDNPRNHKELTSNASNIQMTLSMGGKDTWLDLPWASVRAYAVDGITINFELEDEDEKTEQPKPGLRVVK